MKNYPYREVPNLTDNKLCIYCCKIIIVGDFKLFKEYHLFKNIYYPNAPDCYDTIIDWIEI